MSIINLGSGMVRVGTCVDEENCNHGIFFEMTNNIHPIGESEAIAGEELDIFSFATMHDKTLLYFKNTKSIDVVINQLSLLKKSMLENSAKVS